MRSKRVHIYIEGGRSKGDIEFRAALDSFFGGLKEVVKPGWGLSIIPCGGRENTYKNFVTALDQVPSADAVVLLVDAEDLPEGCARDHVSTKKRQTPDNWDMEGVSEKQVYLMTVVMETWFLADCESIREHMKKKQKAFDADKLEHKGNPEIVSKQTVYSKLDSAIKNLKYGSDGYEKRKGDLSFEFLGCLNADAVRMRCDSLDRLFVELPKYLNDLDKLEQGK